MRQALKAVPTAVILLSLLWVMNPAWSAPKSNLLNVNTATSHELQALPGIGPKKADAIITFRTTNGPFGHVDDLVQVKGIGPKTLAKLRPLVTVGKLKKAKSHADGRGPGSG